MKKSIVPAYLCDFERVTDCPKTDCQTECTRTLKLERAKFNEQGKPIIVGYIRHANKSK